MTPRSPNLSWPQPNPTKLAVCPLPHPDLIPPALHEPICGLPLPADWPNVVGVSCRPPPASDPLPGYSVHVQIYTCVVCVESHPVPFCRVRSLFRAATPSGGAIDVIASDVNRTSVRRGGGRVCEPRSEAAPRVL
ncbi:uncharacterized protein B0H18DRAFT_982244 [Fomitopsis serialis]|uniref:uncharacterized protein n=1 Tax=Fomitopsis serialis TaxID=139415 RepID=UPI002008D61F|nr:uncharacterized protein B0H18DRAFT_982244 [Neoantrodia serialis]KAH9933822.1 hypothetical protein B0H18DRAFT_982244 [Neoantrodia serialis]